MTEITETDVRLMRRQGDLAEFIRGEVARARGECPRRRALVLSQPDLAERLTAGPINLSTPQAWNGYLPPEQWNGRRNDSPVRTALVALVAEAEQHARARYGAAA